MRIDLVPGKVNTLKFFYWFLVANFFTFGLIAALQFVEFPWFFLVLLAMHGGVFLFIASKRGFWKFGIDVKKVYILQDILLALYLPILAAKLMSRFGWIVFPSALKTALVLALTAVAYIITVWNSARLYRIWKNK